MILMRAYDTRLIIVLNAGERRAAYRVAPPPYHRNAQNNEADIAI